jgi:molybdate transport system substrate-binding protein
MRIYGLFCTIIALTAFLTTAASGAELKIFGSRVTKMVIGEVGSQFEQATGYKPVVMTDVAAVMKRRIESGEDFDVAVLVDFQTDDLIKSGKLLADTRADVMRAGIGVAVRKGSTKPEIATVEAFKQTLLSAKSIVYLREGASTRHLDEIFVRLGIADAIKSKTIQPTTESVSEMVADGEAEIGIIVVPNILSVEGAELVGPLPSELQSYIVFSAGVSAQSQNQKAARELIRFLSGPAILPVLRQKGMEPG